MTKMNNMEELTKQLENTRNFVFYCPDDRDAIEKAIECLKQLQEIKDYLELSVKDSDKFKQKYAEIAEHTHNFNDLYYSNLFEGMAEAYSDILERYFKEKDL